MRPKQLVGQGLPTEAWGSPRHGLALCKQPLESQLAEALCHLVFDRGTHLGGAATLCPDVARRGVATGLAIGSRAKTCTVEPSRSPSDTSVYTNATNVKHQSGRMQLDT